MMIVAFFSQKINESLGYDEVLMLFKNISHTVRLTIWCQLFLYFWLVHTWVFAYPRGQHSVTHLKNVRQLNLRWGQKATYVNL